MQIGLLHQIQHPSQFHEHIEIPEIETNRKQKNRYPKVKRRNPQIRPIFVLLGINDLLEGLRLTGVLLLALNLLRAQFLFGEGLGVRVES